MVGKLRISAILACLCLPATAVLADGWQAIGNGRLLVNDVLYDINSDRGRTGSLAASRVWARNWSGELPSQLGQVLELRFLADLRAPDSLRFPAPTDRPYAGALSLGVHTHSQIQGFDVSLGGDLVVTGPQTRLDEFQTAFHDLIGIRAPSSNVLDDQIENGVHPTLVFEAGRAMTMAQDVELRPFLEGRVGAETLARIGFDLTIGGVSRDPLRVRDPASGHRYRVVRDEVPGWSFVLGADVAAVEDSVFLPEDRGYELVDSFARARAGVFWQGAESSFFYGLTWFDKEFEGQPDDQVVGAVQLSLRF